jgi:L-serine dehydratase
MSKHPSIFNDVIGPVMRGPSSSHCAASLRIGRICRDLMGGSLKRVQIEFDPNGSLATTHKAQGSDMGMFGGFLGWEAFDDRLVDAEQHLSVAGISVSIDIRDIGAAHPNTYKFTLQNEQATHTLTALSTGGGMIEVVEIDGAAVSMMGDYFETLVYTRSPKVAAGLMDQGFSHDEILVHDGQRSFVEIKAQAHPDASLMEELLHLEGVSEVVTLHPVMPVMARKNLVVPFTNCSEMFDYDQGKGRPLWELAVDYEASRGGMSRDEVFSKMREIVQIMGRAIETGLLGTSFEDRILGSQSPGFRKKMENGALIKGDLHNRIIMYVSAIMEVKSSMGVIVAAPTAGSCGALPGALFAVAHESGYAEEEIVKGMLAAGLIGVYIAGHATFAAEVGGCMAETGSGGGMAAAAIVGMKGGTLKQSIAAASLALQNSLGIICDPIGNRVEAPCLGRNVMAATNALSSANMALADYEHLVPLDEVIDTMKAVGDKIHHTLRCTNLGGLAITKAAKEIERKLEEREGKFFKSC